MHALYTETWTNSFWLPSFIPTRPQPLQLRSIDHVVFTKRYHPHPTPTHGHLHAVHQLHVINRFEKRFSISVMAYTRLLLFKFQSLNFVVLSDEKSSPGCQGGYNLAWCYTRILLLIIPLRYHHVPWSTELVQFLAKKKPSGLETAGVLRSTAYIFWSVLWLLSFFSFSMLTLFLGWM